MIRSAHNSAARRAMLAAWGVYAAAKAEGRPRAFGDCLHSGWEMERRAAAYVASLQGRAHLEFSPSLIQSPLARRYGRRWELDYVAAYTTAVVGG